MSQGHSRNIFFLLFITVKSYILPETQLQSYNIEDQSTWKSLG